MTHQLLADYLSIYKKFPQPKLLSKPDRKLRDECYQQWLKTDYDDWPSMEAVGVFMATHKNCLNDVFFQKLEPLFLADLEQGNTDGVKILLADGENSYFESNGHAFSRVNLYEAAGILLLSEPDYRPALLYRYRVMDRYVSYTMHERPWMILVHKEELPEMLAYLEEFAQLSQKLNKIDQDEAWIAEVRASYLAWQDYLDKQDLYEYFPAYLEAQLLLGDSPKNKRNEEQT